MKFVIWLAALAPIVIWLITQYFQPKWWIENLTAYPGLFFIGYLSLFLLSAITKDKVAVVTTFCLAMFFFSLTPKHERIEKQCDSDASFDVIQFNVFYDNPDINSFINALIQQPADLVVMQEVSPQLGEQLRMLDDIYPFRYGGQEGIGYPSSQLILSRHPLSGFSVFHTPDAQNVISGEWQVTKDRSIHLVTAHPPSPRNQALWYRRNALIRTIESIVVQYPFPDTLIVGDFNISSKSAQFTRLFSDFETLPVASWPNWISGNVPPAFTMIAIDHLWLKSEANDWRICSREALKTVYGSDHLMIRTRIALKP